jgi:predicted enzyme related to lactoylglutathione lyase
MAYPVTHFEVIGKDNKKLRDFYSKAFDWKLTDAPEDYAMVDTGANGHGINGGIGPSRTGKSSVTFYIETEDLSGTLARVEKLGGKTVMPPMKAGRSSSRCSRIPRATSSASPRECDTH